MPPLTVNGAADQTGTLSPTLSHREIGAAAGKAIAVDGERGSVLVHRGCVAQVLADSANRNAEKLLDGAGYRMVRLAHTVCCGALDLHSGNRKRALEFARANVRAIKNSGAEFVISTASGCSTAMAEYGELLKDDPELAATAREVSAQVKELSGLLLQGDQPFHGRMECMVTYHDACHLAHGLGIREAPRALLRSILGVKLVEMESSDLCCGSAGSYNLTHPKPPANWRSARPIRLWQPARTTWFWPIPDASSRSPPNYTAAAPKSRSCIWRISSRLRLVAKIRVTKNKGFRSAAAQCG